MASRQATLEYLTTTKIGEKGQLTVPKQFREDLGVGTGVPQCQDKPYEPNNPVKRVLHPTFEARGLPKAGWRAFRWSVATALSEMREPVGTAQLILGHSSAQTTLVYYVQSVEESQQSAITRLEKIMSASSRKSPS